jgi:hypothetical protein
MSLHCLECHWHLALPTCNLHASTLGLLFTNVRLTTEIDLPCDVRVVERFSGALKAIKGDSLAILKFSCIILQQYVLIIGVFVVKLCTFRLVCYWKEVPVFTLKDTWRVSDIMSKLTNCSNDIWIWLLHSLISMVTSSSPYSILDILINLINLINP